MSLPLLPLLLLVGTLLFTGCGLFDTRDPEDPVGANGTADVARSPGEVLDLMEAAITLRDPTTYMNLISQHFQYQATPSAYPSDPGRFEGWSFNDEDNYIRQLLSSSTLPADSLRELVFEPIQELEWADSVYYQERYRLEVHLVPASLPQVYEGLMEATIVRGEDNAWRILRWRDDASGEAATLSVLRAALR